MVSIEEVSFGYGKEWGNLKAVTLEISQGECVLLCGESGCGKTTVTKLINGLIPHFYPDCAFKGKVTAAGMALADAELHEIAKRVGSVFQNPKSQFFNLDSDSELAFGLENEGAPREYIRKRLDETVRDLNIHHLTGRSIFAMSGGEKQTLAFACVYAMNPDVYVLDEPTANLDPEAIERLRTLLAALKAAGKTIVIAEHRLYFLADLIDRAVYIKAGRILYSYSAEEFYSLTDSERETLGLRSLTDVSPVLPEARTGGSPQGLSVEGLTCAFGKEAPVISDLSFSVLPGQVLGIIGSNGAGKTTLARCLCGLVKEKAGHIRRNGHALSHKQRQKTAFLVMQDVNHQLFSDSVWGECQMTAGDGLDSRIEEVLAGFSLLSYRESHPMALSGGQKQRLAILTAILSGKELLVFDEPTSGLDYSQMRNVIAIVRKLSDEEKMIVVVSHDREFLALACDCVLEL